MVENVGLDVGYGSVCLDRDDVEKIMDKGFIITEESFYKAKSVMDKIVPVAISILEEEAKVIIHQG